MTPNRQNPFLFACGVPRSGTTLLQRMLDGHPDLAVANDSHFIPRALELTNKRLIEIAQDGNPILLTPELANRVFQYHRFYRMGITKTEFNRVLHDSETYRDLVSGLYELYARKRNKRLGGEKTPDYVRRLKLLHAQFPTAKLIHLIRDGRDVALSLREWASPNKGPGRLAMWEPNWVAVSALWWRWMVVEARKQMAAVEPGVYFEVHYEELVAEPEMTLRSVCEFLEIDYCEQMVNYHLGKSRAANKLSAKSAWLAPQQGLRDWRREMKPEQVQLFEVLASDALQEFGYETRRDTLSDQTLSSARECQTWWNQHFLPNHQRNDCTIDATQPRPPDTRSTSEMEKAV